jgi:hypothetical protein
VIFHVLAIAVLDAYILLKSQNPNSVITHRVFRKKLVTALVWNNLKQGLIQRETLQT